MARAPRRRCTPSSIRPCWAPTRPTSTSARPDRSCASGCDLGSRANAAPDGSLELREELPDFRLGPGLRAIVPATIHVAGSVAPVEGAPFDGIAGFTTLISGARVLPAALAGLRRRLGRAAIVAHELVPHGPPAGDVERAITDAV